MNATTKRTRPRGFAPWTPRPASLELVQNVQAVLADYADHLPLTIRQVFYRLVATQGFDKTETAYARLAVTREQADRLGLPTAPPKPTDRRQFSGETVQAEAIDPATLSGILRDAIETRRDDDTAAEVLALEAEMRAALVAKLGGGND
jgi:hypothetical protein